MAEETWPPVFTLDQNKILRLLTGDRFYTNPSAALREAVLNSIDAIRRRRHHEPAIRAHIHVEFNHIDTTLTVSDNGAGMSREDVTEFFTKVGASAAELEANQESVGEFGIGVVSYFMAGDSFDLQTYDGKTEPLGLSFDKGMLAGGKSAPVSPSQETQGTTVTIHVRNAEIFKLLLDSFSHWCRDVDGLSARLLPEDRDLPQSGVYRAGTAVEVEQPDWVERAHLSPVSEPTRWDAMTGNSIVAVLYRGVFVQEFEVAGIWGIEGSIDVDPKHFKPRLNREGFVQGVFESEVTEFLKRCHPKILETMAARLADAVAKGELDEWDEKRWASLWLAVPRNQAYASTNKAWDSVFRSLPAFELARGNKWEGVSLERLVGLSGEVFVAPLADEKTNDVISAASRFLRNTGKSVIRGIRRDRTWMRNVPATYGTTADLIYHVFAGEVTSLTRIAEKADQILNEIERTAPLFTGPPPVDLVRLGADSPPAIRLSHRLVINTDNPAGAAIVEAVLRENAGPMSLIAIASKHAFEQLSQVAAAVRKISAEPEFLSPVRRRFIRSRLP